MNFVSVIVPAFSFSEVYTNCSNKVVQEFFNLTDDSNLEYYELNKIDDISTIKSTQIAIKIKTSDLSLTMLERLMEENNQLKVSLQKCKESIKILTTELDNCLNNQKNEEEQQKCLSKANDEIKKLKTLLTQQLQNAEKMRIDTQNTVDTLKTEFDLLELGNVHSEQELNKEQNKHLFETTMNNLEVNSKALQEFSTFQEQQQIKNLFQEGQTKQNYN